MKTIVKNKSKFSFLKGSIDSLERAQVKEVKPQVNREILTLYREVLKMT